MQASPKHVRAPHAHTIDYSTRIVRRSRSWENGRASVLSMAELTRKPRRVVEGVAGRRCTVRRSWLTQGVTGG